MKHMRLTFEDEEFNQLEAIKEENKAESWREFFLTLAGLQK